MNCTYHHTSVEHPKKKHGQLSNSQSQCHYNLPEAEALQYMGLLAAITGNLYI